MHEINQEQNSNSKNKYEIHIDNFDGPLDILWDLIKKSKIDITEISISAITEQYISFLKHMESLNISIASEFIWMASELLYYKSISLLPSKEIEDEYFVPPLPPELIEKLLEYKKYQQSSIDLRAMYDNQMELFHRINTINSLHDDEDELIEVSLFDLLRAFANALESQTEIEQEEIVFDEILVSDKIDYIAELLKEKEIIHFTDLYQSDPGRAEIIPSFLAILEMSKTQLIKLYQHRVFGDIRIKRNFSIKDV